MLRLLVFAFIILESEQKADCTSRITEDAEVKELFVENFEVKRGTELNFFLFSGEHFGVVAWLVGWFLLPRVAIAYFKVDSLSMATVLLNVTNKKPAWKRLLHDVDFEKHVGMRNNNNIFSPVARLHLDVGVIFVAH